MSAKYKPSDYEVLRRRCVELKESGWKQNDIALALGLTEGWVSQTLKKYRESGYGGLSARKPPGALPKLKPEQLSELVEALNLGAVSHGSDRQAFRCQLRPDAGGAHFEKGWVESAKARQEGPSAEQPEGRAVAGADPVGYKKKLRMRIALSYMSMNQGFTYCPLSAARGHRGGRHPSSRRRQVRNTSV